jgi:HEAT repeat protein
MSCGRSAVVRTGLAATLTALLCFGCASGATNREQLRSPNAFERAAAAVRSAEAGDAGAVHTLVDLLEDRDGGVRLYAIGALERLTGQTYEYQHFASESQRQAAVERWRDALRRGEVRLNRTASTRSQAPNSGLKRSPPASTVAGDTGKGER